MPARSDEYKLKDEIERLLAAKDPGVAGLARRMCELILDSYPDAVVSIDRNDIGFGRGSGYKGLAFTVSPHRSHVTLGIAGGATLPDPAGLMEGSGKVHRHVKIRQNSDLDRWELRALIAAAVTRADSRSAHRPGWEG
jgi:hypothetical protein